MKRASSKPLQILYITPGGLGARGGMGSFARYLLPALAEQDIPAACRVIDSYGPGPFFLMPFYFLHALAQVIRHAALKTADVAHIHMSHRGSALRKLTLVRVATWLGLPTLLHIHGSEFEVYAESLPPRRRKWLVENLIRASHIAVLGNAWRDYLVQGLGIDAAKVSVVPNGVPLPPLPPQSLIDAKPCRIVALGLMSKRKGTPELLQALASPKMQALWWKAFIAGNGNVSRFRSEAARLGLSERADMPGWLDPAEAKQNLATADIFVLPSRNEGLPIAILEAMAAGVAVVTTPVGAIPDLVLHNETGLMVPPGDAKALADALAQLVVDPAKRRLFGQKGRKRVETEFGIGHCARKIASLYASLAA
jgi:glycosyltransferase involved in cell wall biosynthesis